MTPPRVAIAGVATSKFAKALPDKTELDLRIEAAVSALGDAGIPMKDVDGLLVNERHPNPRDDMEFCESLGLRELRLSAPVSMGGAAPGHSVEVARWALRSGRCNYVLIVNGFKASIHGRSTRGNAMTDAMATLTMHYPDYEHPFGPLMVSFYALKAQRHMFEYGTTPEQLSAVSVAARYNAGLNPDAVYRSPLTIDDVLASPVISTPLHKLHCPPMTDGAVAFVMTTEERAKDLRTRPVYVEGSGGGQEGYYMGFLAKGGNDRGYSLTRTLGARAARDAFGEAGLTPQDVDLACLCDNFAISCIIHLEDYGFCAPGEGGPFVGSGERIRVGGDLPINPHGGLSSCGHAATNYQNYVEATLQLRGDCGDRQVPDAKVAVAASSAGVISTHYVQVLTRG